MWIWSNILIFHPEWSSTGAGSPRTAQRKGIVPVQSHSRQLSVEACTSRLVSLLRFDANVIVYRNSQRLLAARILLCGLHADMPREKLDFSPVRHRRRGTIRRKSASDREVRGFRPGGRFLTGCVVVPLGETEAHEAGRLLGMTKALRQRTTIPTSDPDDIARLVRASGRKVAVVAI